MDPALPDDIIFEEILSRLPVKSLVRFRYVCKSWKSLLSDSGFMQPHLNRSISQNPNDDYLIRTWHGGIGILSRTNLCESPIDNIPYPVPCIDHVELVGSINGLVCLVRLSKPDIRFLLWNPAIHLFKEILLPEHCRSYSGHQHYRFGFSWDSVANDFKLIAKYYALTYSSGSFRYSPPAVVYSSKTNCWSNIAFDPIIHVCQLPSVIVKGIPYWKCSPHTMILKFEARNNEFSYLTVSYDSYKFKINLVNLNDCLARIEYARKGADSMDVYQFNEEYDGWSKMFTVNFGKNDIFSKPVCFKYSGEIVFTGNSYLWDSKSDKIESLDYYDYVHGHSYTPSMVVLEGMEPLHRLPGGERSLRSRMEPLHRLPGCERSLRSRMEPLHRLPGGERSLKRKRTLEYRFRRYLVHGAKRHTILVGKPKP